MKNDRTQADSRRLKNDFILIIAIAVIAVLSFLILRFWVQKEGDKVVITLDGTVYGEYLLRENQTIHIESSTGLNTVVIKDGVVFMQEADCPDQICVKHSSIHRTKESIVCLPHRLVVEVVRTAASKKQGIDGVAE